MTNATEPTTINLLDLERERGRVSGEVRVLKWAVGVAFVALIAAFGAIYTEMNQGFREVNQQFRDVNGRIDQLAYGVSDVRERLARVEGQIGDLRAAGTPQGPEPLP